MSQISQISKVAVSITVTAAVTLSPTSLPQLPPVPQQPNHVFCNLILRLVGVVPFSTNKNMFFACKHFLLVDTFVTKARFYHFFLHQKQSKCSRMFNVRKKAWQTLFIVNPVLDMPAHLSTQEVGLGGGLAASYTRTSTDNDSSLLSSRIRIPSDRNRLGPVSSVSLIHNSQSRCTERD